MASWNGKMNLPKTSSSKATSSGNTTAGKSVSSEPQPSTSRGISGTTGTNRSITLSAIREVPAVNDWLNNLEAANPGIAQMKFEGFLYAERVKTFIDNKWPAWMDHVDTSKISTASRRSSSKRKIGAKSTEPGEDLCTPYELAMAGFMYYPEDKQVKCFVCHRRKSADDFSNITDPWNVHKEMFPECPLVKLGKPARPDDYTMGTILTLMGECEAQRLEYEYEELEKKTLEMLEHIKKQKGEE